MWRISVNTIQLISNKNEATHLIFLF